MEELKVLANPKSPSSPGLRVRRDGSNTGTRYTLVLLLSLVFALPARAQQKEAFAVDGLHGFVELGVRSRAEESSYQGSRADLDELEFEELLHLDGTGYVYLPRFLTYRISADLRLLQETVASTNDVLSGGRWSLSFFEQHPYSFELFRDDRQTQVDQPFFRSYEETSSIYGATLRIRPGPLPTELSYTHRSSERSGTRSDLDEVSDEFAVRARHDLGEASRTKLEYFHTEEENRGRDISRHRFFLNHRSYFDAQKRKRFIGNLQFRQQDDAGRERETTTAAGHFSWQHGDRLSTEYTAQFHRNDTDYQESNDLNLGASVRHRLYESLTSNVEVFTRLQDASFGDTERFGLNVTEEYTKRLGGWGRLDIDFSPYAELVRNRPTQTTAQVFDEPRVMPDVAPVQLGQRWIDPTTIVVTDSSGSTIYLEGIDYLVFVSGDVTELTRLATGTIAPAERVLVDYVYQLPGPSDLLTRGLRLDGALAMREWLVLFTQLRFSEEEQRSGDPGRELETRDRQVIGASVSRGWVSSRLEFERDHSNYQSFTGMSQWLSVSVPKRTWWHASFVTNGSFRSYDEGGESVTRIASTLRFGADVGLRGQLSAAIDYRLEDWSGDPSAGFRDLEGFGLMLSFDWRFRSVDLSMGGSISWIERQGHEESVDRLFLRVRRNF